MTNKSKSQLWSDWGRQEDGRQSAPAATRNRDAILEVLKQELPDSGTILEIAAGTGEHAVYFAPQFPHLSWQSTDYEDDKIESITAWQKHSPSANLLKPETLDASADIWPVETHQPAGPITAILCVNMIHIAPWSATLGLFAGAGRVLPVGGKLILYGPFKKNAQHTAPSNDAFDKKLKSRDPSWGIRDLADLDQLASAQKFSGHREYAMPANNYTVVWEKGA